MSDELASQIMLRLRARAIHVAVQRTWFADLCWDLSSHESMMLVATMFDALGNRRRVVVAEVRDEVRYWWTRDRTPSADSENRLGVFSGRAEAVDFCERFLGGE